MAVKSKEEIIAQITSTIGDSTSDEAIALLEDVNDTLSSLADTNADGKDWKSEAERIDREWREKYIARFSNSSADDDEPSVPQGFNNKPKTFEDLFN
jgi:hypothetical protein